MAMLVAGVSLGCQAHRRDYDSMTPEQRSFHLEESIEVARPRAEVAAFLADPCKEFLWQPWLRKARMHPPTDGMGTTRHYTNRFAGKTIINEYVTQTHDAERGISYRTTTAADVQATGGTSLVSLGEQRTRVTLTFDPQALGFYWYMSDRQTKRVYRRSLRARMRDLAEVLEAGDYDRQLEDKGVQRRATATDVLCWI